MNFRTRRRPDDVELNFVPLIDVLVVLLIFLMVTTSFSRLGQLKVELPQAAAQVEDNVIELAISADGEYAFQGVTIRSDDRAGLMKVLRQAAVDAKDKVLALSVDGKTPHEQVIAAMVAAREAGFEHLAFTVETAGAAP